MKIAERIYWVGSGAVGISAEWDCHTYLVEGSDGLALIDCGMCADPVRILENVRADGLDPRSIKYCLLTHAHYDHAGGCEALRRSGVRLAGSVVADEVLQKGAIDFYGLCGAEASMAPWREMGRSALDQTLKTGDTLSLGDVRATAILTPGHSLDSACYLFEMPSGMRALFSGDEIFYKGFISVLAPPLNDLAHYPQGLEALGGLEIDGLFPGHLMWVLKGGQQYIDIARQAFAEMRMPVNKPFS